MYLLILYPSFKCLLIIPTPPTADVSVDKTQWYGVMDQTIKVPCKATGSSSDVAQTKWTGPGDKTKSPNIARDNFNSDTFS